MKGFDLVINAYMEHTNELLAVARSIVRNTSEAEDVVQNTLLKFVKEPERCRGVMVALPFLRTCVRNEAIDYLRAKSGDGSSRSDAESTAYREPGYDRTEQLIFIDESTRKVPPEYRDAFIRHVIDGWPVRELARELGISKSNLQKKFYKIKLGMRDELDTDK